MKKYLFIIFVMLFIFQSSYAAEWWKDAVFYEVFVRSFYDSDKDGNGDLKGLTMKLDYLNDGDPATQTDLGVNALWLMPLFKCGSYHGYDTEDYYSINPEYGTMQDFEKLIAAAHERGIKIILDLVINHSSHRHEWFVKSSRGDEDYRDYYIWEKEIPGDKWGRAWGGGSPEDVWNYYGLRKAWYYSAFNYRMPDLNLRNQKVREEIFAIAKFWLDKGVDGFRLDAARYMIEDGPGEKQADRKDTIKWWKDFRNFVKSINPDTVLVGEVWTSNDRVVKYYNKGQALDLCFNFDLAEKIPAAARYGNMNNFVESINNIKKLPAPLDFYAPFLSNHDTIRSMNLLDNDILNAKIASLILLTMPGTPFIYYGEELGMVQENGKNDKLKRAPMLWNTKRNAGFSKAKSLWYPQIEHNAKVPVASQAKDNQSLLTFYKKMIMIRQQQDTLRKGTIDIVDIKSKKALCYSRSSKKDRFVILLNGSKKDQEVDLSEISEKKWMDLISDKEIVFEKGLTTLVSKEFYLLKEID